MCYVQEINVVFVNVGDVVSVCFGPSIRGPIHFCYLSYRSSPTDGALESDAPVPHRCCKVSKLTADL